MSPLRAAAAVLGVFMLSACAMSTSDSNNEISRGQRLIGQTTTVQRRLQSGSMNTTQCIWSEDVGCDLNADFVTTLGRVPATETQKLLARTGALAKKCGGYVTSSACLATPGDSCSWDGLYNYCRLGNAFLKVEWFAGRLDCPGSLSNKATVCSRITSESACNGNNNCMWGPGVLAGFASIFTSTVMDWVGSATSILSSQCAPKWVLDNNIVGNLANKVAAATLPAKPDAYDNLRAVYDDVMGTCAGATAFKNMLAGCTGTAAAANRVACESLVGCAWTAITADVGSCDVALTFPVALIANQSDPWAISLNNAKKQCLPLNETSCDASAAITVNTTLYADFSPLQPVFPIYTGSASRSNPAHTVLISLLFTFAMGMFVRKM